jgi:hypothetical protein
LPKSAIDVIGNAFEHTRKQLSEPFRFSQWARLAVLGLATGEISSGGGCNFRSLDIPSHLPSHSQNFADSGGVFSQWGLDLATIASLIVVAIVGFLVLALVWIYIASISRFMLFEAVLRKDCELTESWNRWQRQGLRYFGWQLGLAAIALAVAAMLFIPLLIPVLAALRHNQEPGLGLMLAFLPMISVFLTFALVLLLITVLAKDFVVPIMAIANVGVLEGWSRLFAMMKADPWAYAGYLGMKIILAIGAAVMFAIVSAIVVVAALIPIGIVTVIVVIMAKAVGLAWNAFTITAAIVAAVIVFAALLYVVGLACVPVAVFFPAYAMYFFAERYAALRAQVYPAPPLPPAIPPLSPMPQPAG